MKAKTDLEPLIEKIKEITNLCGGAPLYAIVYCCSIQKPCPIRDTALKMLGIPKEKYEMIKEKHRLAHNGVCFKNLAYCCSLAKNCPAREKAMQELGITPTDYWEYKAKILKDLMKIAKCDKEVWNEKIIRPLFFYVIDPEKSIAWKGFAKGNLDLQPPLLFILKIQGREKIDLNKVKKSGS